MIKDLINILNILNKHQILLMINNFNRIKYVLLNLNILVHIYKIEIFKVYKIIDNYLIIIYIILIYNLKIDKVKNIVQT